MEPEVWRALPAVGFEGAYEVSSRGRIRRVRGGQGTRGSRHTFRMPTPGANGYLAVTLTANGHRRQFYVHELVALAFIGPRPPGLQVNHRDRDRRNNRPGNLEYTTPLGNSRHGYVLRGTGKKLTAEAVLEIRRRLGDGERNAALAREYCVDPDTIGHIKRRVTWKHI